MSQLPVERMPQGILLFFIDGVGLGENSIANPLVSASMPTLRKFLGGHPLTQEAIGKEMDGFLGALDACLGIAGLPQSATGQATLLTGQNIAKVLDRHWPGLPTKTIQERILKFSIFKKLKERGQKGYFANYFDQGYFERAKMRRYPHSATTWSVLAAQMEVEQDISFLEAGKAVCHDLTGEWLMESQRTSSSISPIEAGRRLGRVAMEYDFTLYEYFLTDKAGHEKDQVKAEQVLAHIDQALAGILETFDFERNLLLFVSDHGNIEDLSVRGHSFNLVPLIGIGKGAKEVVHFAKDLTDLAKYLNWWSLQKISKIKIASKIKI